MKNFILQRYYLHSIIGITLAYIIAYNTDFLEYPIQDMIVADISLSVVVWIFAGIYEVLQSMYVKRKSPNTDSFDWYDIHFSGGGAVLGCTTYFFIHNQYVYYGMIAVFVAVWIYEIVRIIKAK